MMNDDNSITVETALYGYIAEEAHSNRFCAIVNKLFKGNNVNAMAIPMNIRPDDVSFTISQMRTSKLSGAVISMEYQEEAYGLLDNASEASREAGYSDFIRIQDGKLLGELIMPSALEKFAQCDDFEDDIALNSMTRYFYELTTGEYNE
jgi:shikimate 5-dehydrogenase